MSWGVIVSGQAQTHTQTPVTCRHMHIHRSSDSTCRRKHRHIIHRHTSTTSIHKRRHKHKQAQSSHSHNHRTVTIIAQSQLVTITTQSRAQVTHSCENERGWVKKYVSRQNEINVTCLLSEHLRCFVKWKKFETPPLGQCFLPSHPLFRQFSFFSYHGIVVKTDKNVHFWLKLTLWKIWASPPVNTGLGWANSPEWRDPIESTAFGWL
jgi:hypothetical protein